MTDLEGADLRLSGDCQPRHAARQRARCARLRPLGIPNLTMPAGRPVWASGVTHGPHVYRQLSRMEWCDSCRAH